MESEIDVLRRIVDLARRTREKQKEYFKLRGPQTLRWAKALEAQLDRELDKCYSGPDLFDQLERSE